MSESGSAAMTPWRAAPGRRPGWWPGPTALTVEAVVVVATGFGWVMAVLFSDPVGIARDPVRGYLWCVGFAALATAASVAAVAARRRPVSAILVVCGLALWALLPATVFLAYFAVQVIGVFVTFVAAPLLLAGAAWVLVLRGRVARGAAVLLVALLVACGGLALWTPVLPIAAWLPVVLWQLALAIAAAVTGLARSRGAPG